VDQSFITWKYLENPAGQAIARGAWDGGRLTGFAALLPQRFCVHGQEHLVGLGEDMAAPGRDREETVVRMTEGLLEEMNGRGWLWRYCVPDGRDGSLYVNRLGHKRATEAPFWVKPRTGRIIKGLLGLQGSRKETSGFRMAYHSYKVRMVREFDDRFDRLWEKCAKESPVAPVKSAEVLNWMYLRHSAERHRILTVEDQGKLKGFAVLRGSDLMDIFCDVDTDAYKTMIKAMEKVWRPSAQGSSLAWVTGDRLAAQALAKAGWREGPGMLGPLRARRRLGITVYANPGAEKGGLGAKGGSWRLSLGDIPEFW
jgi:hypothetical protein